MRLPYEFCAAENAICRTHLTVRQFNHFTTLLRTSEFMQVSPFLSTVAIDHFSRCTFLNIWKCLLFTGDGFAGARSIDLTTLSNVHETFSQMAPWFRSIRLTASQKLQRNFFCFMSSVHVQSILKSKSTLFVFRTCTTHQKVTLVSPGTNASATLGKNQKRSVCCCFSWTTESGTFERLSVFPERTFDFHGLQEQIQ